MTDTPQHLLATVGRRKNGSTFGQEEDRRRSQEAGFDFHLTKPLDPNMLEALVASPRSFSLMLPV